MENINLTERWISIIGGGALAAYGLARRSKSSLLFAGVGGALLWRGATGHCPIYGALGISTARERGDEESQVSVPYGRGIRVEESVLVNAKPEVLYSFWRDFENLPRFLNHLEMVHVIDDRHSQWRAHGPAGVKVEWEAEIINEIPNELIGWRSVDGSNVHNAGSVHFTPRRRGTEVRVLLRYDPPGGELGAKMAKLLGDDPEQQIREDLERFKQIMEDVSELASRQRPGSAASRGLAEAR